MNFEFNGQTFFLNFVPDEGRWFLYAPTAMGMQRMPVADDAHMHFDTFVMPPIMEDVTIS
jgi:hypothetical protein